MVNTYYYDTEIGKIYISEEENFITCIRFEHEVSDNEIFNETEIIREAGNQIIEYLKGKRKNFDIPILPKGTAFQQKVWEALRVIPYGETRSYGEIASNIGNEKACRAVGNANNKNPIPIIIPCHRVVGSNGKLVGYAGGLFIKNFLLNLECNNK